MINPVITKTQRCNPCGGSGLVEAGGFVKKDCTNCKGSGNIQVVADDIDYLLAKGTEHYAAAKQKIKALDANLTDAQAEALLDAELAAPAAPPKPTPKEGTKKHGKARPK
jgi:DnaJ-class molecular chaperone